MIIPVRCFSCGKVVGQHWEEFQKNVKAGKNPGKVLDELGIKRYCCRSMLIGHIDLIKKVGKFKV